jgi:multidrug efflux system membrane fusion protein
VSLDPIYAAFDLDEQTFLRYGNLATAGKRASARQTGLPIQMALAAEPEFPHEGTLNFVDNQIDPDTGTIRGRAVFDNADHALTPGLFVRLRVPGASKYEGVLIRDGAVGTDLDKRFVLVVKDDGTTEYRPVTLGPTFERLRIVRSGLSPGDLVVVNGLQRVRPGMKVDPAKVAMEAPADAQGRGAAPEQPQAEK